MEHHLQAPNPSNITTGISSPTTGAQQQQEQEGGEDDGSNSSSSPFHLPLVRWVWNYFTGVYE